MLFFLPHPISSFFSSTKGKEESLDCRSRLASNSNFSHPFLQILQPPTQNSQVPNCPLNRNNDKKAQKLREGRGRNCLKIYSGVKSKKLILVTGLYHETISPGVQSSTSLLQEKAKFQVKTFLFAEK